MTDCCASVFLPRLNAKMLYVLGPSTADEYWQFVTDYGNVRRYLQEKHLGQVVYVNVALCSNSIRISFCLVAGADLARLIPCLGSKICA
jgi:hypothetical protein